MSLSSRGTESEPSQEKPRFRPDYLELITRTALRVLPGSAAAHRLDTLSVPEGKSPFLTLALRSDRGLRTHVLKVMVVLRTEASHQAWAEVFTQERQRLEKELASRRTQPDTLTTLPLPLLDEGPRIHYGELSPLRHADLLERPGKLGAQDTAFPYVLRPYIPWPKLQETGYQAERRQALFRTYFQQRKIQPPALDSPEGRRLLKYFAGVALVNGTAAGQPSVLLASEWQLTTQPPKA
jgi:hypothetical protein